jgi:hypothetical protein
VRRAAAPSAQATSARRELLTTRQQARLWIAMRALCWRMKQILLAATVAVACLCSCATPPPQPLRVDPCAAGEASYACQVERYRNANM